MLEINPYILGIQLGTIGATLRTIRGWLKGGGETKVAGVYGSTKTPFLLLLIYVFNESIFDCGVVQMLAEVIFRADR